MIIKKLLEMLLMDEYEGSKNTTNHSCAVGNCQ